MQRRFAVCAAFFGLGVLASDAAPAQVAASATRDESVSTHAGATLPGESLQISTVADGMPAGAFDESGDSPLGQAKPLRGVAYDRAFTRGPVDCPGIDESLPTKRLARR